MTNRNEDAKAFELKEEVLSMVNGGTDESDLSEDTVMIWKQMYGQPDGSYRFVCSECGAVITDTNFDNFHSAVCAHILSHTDNDMGDILNPWNTYWDTRRNITY